MKRITLLTVSAALTAALASPLALAQQTSTDTSASNGQDSKAMSQNPSATERTTPSASTDSTMPGAHSGSSMQGQHSDSTIRQVQQALKDRGLFEGEVDGIMGPKTEQALQQFQQREGLSGANGLDAQTLAALNLESSSAGAASSSPGSSSGSSGSSSSETSGSSSDTTGGSSTGSSSGTK